MTVCIAEKPSVARDIAAVLGANNKRDGYMEGNGYQVTWTFGHLCTLKEPHEYDPLWKTWSLGSLPMIPKRFGIKLIEDKGIEKQFHIIEKLMQAADCIVNCGDAGQEGELIQRWVMQKAGAKCPVKRLWISSLTEEAIKEGFTKLKDQSEFQPLYEAGLSRAIGDWTLGMNATRLYTLKYGQNGQVLSVGRVQTPTLALIVKRQQEIDNFKPEPYWELKTTYRDTTFSATNGKFTKKEDGEQLLQQVKDTPFTITDISSKKGTEAPPRLFDLTSLQVECNKRFAYSADTTLQAIQSLYEKKITTYPRVDTTFLSDDIYPKCPKILAGLKSYAALTEPLKGKKLTKSKKVFDNSKVTDHHAIIPTGVAPQNLSDIEKNVFDLVARRFIAAFYPDCKFLTTTVLGEAGTEVATPAHNVGAGRVPARNNESGTVQFKTTGKQITDPGWKLVFTDNVPPTPTRNNNGTGSNVGAGRVPARNDEPDNELRTLPTFTVGETGPHKPELLEKCTQPPKPYTEATLLRAMETAGKLVEDEQLRDALKENGIGRPSTRAAIIETLFKRHYIKKERKNLIPTPTGVELISLIREDLLKSAELTGIWEKKLRQIERRDYSAATFIDELKQMVREIALSVLSDNTNRRVTALTNTNTTTHTSNVRAGRTHNVGATLAVARNNNGTPSNVRAGRVPARKKTKPTQITLPEGDKMLGFACPLCGKGIIIKGHTAYGCSEWKNGCNFRKPFFESSNH